MYAVTEHTDTSVTFTLEDNDEFYEMYPFRFRFSIHYYLEESNLRVRLEVENRDEKAMYFGLGGHPGINVPLEPGLKFEDYFLQFPVGNLRRVEFTESCFITGKDDPFPLENHRLPLRHNMFDQDAIVLKGVPGKVTLGSDKGTKSVTLTAPELGVFGFCLLLGYTTADRLISFAVPAVLSLVAVPVLYPLAKAISAIGGESWKE